MKAFAKGVGNVNPGPKLGKFPRNTHTHTHTHTHTKMAIVTTTAWLPGRCPSDPPGGETAMTGPAPPWTEVLGPGGSDSPGR